MQVSRTQPSTRWIAYAVLGSVLFHVLLWFWFEHLRIKRGALPSYEKLMLRKFKLERTEIDPKWNDPKLPGPDKVTPTPGPDRASLPPVEEKRTFAKMLSQTPTSPTMPSGSPPVPQDKPVPAMGSVDTAALDASIRSHLDQQLNVTREAQFDKASKAGSGSGRPILSTPGSPVVPKPGATEVGLPTAAKAGPGTGPVVGTALGGYQGSSHLEDFFGAGGLPPPASVPIEKPRANDTTALVPQSLLTDKPATTQKFDSLNPFLNVELFTYERPAPNGKSEGYFLVRISAKPNAQLSVIPKDVYFILDVSSSIGGERMEVQRATVRDAVGLLNPQDRYKVLAFRDKLSAFRPDWTPASNPRTEELKTWLANLDSGGVTDFYDGLRPLTEHKRESGRMAMAMVLSDGVPTKGLLDSTQIIADLSEANNDRASVFTMSTGTDVNNFLLDLLSYGNQGRLRYTKEVAAAAPAYGGLVREVRNPLFLNLRFKFANVDGSQVYPQNLPNLYQDCPLLLFGRYTPGQTSSISLQILGESQKATKELLVQLPIPKTPQGPEILPQTWARQRIYDVLSRMTRTRAGQDRIMDEVRRLSEEYKVETPYF